MVYTNIREDVISAQEQYDRKSVPFVQHLYYIHQKKRWIEALHINKDCCAALLYRIQEQRRIYKAYNNSRRAITDGQHCMVSA